jgi:hypothetical protein
MSSRGMLSVLFARILLTLRCFQVRGGGLLSELVAQEITVADRDGRQLFELESR